MYRLDDDEAEYRMGECAEEVEKRFCDYYGLKHECPKVKHLLTIMLSHGVYRELEEVLDITDKETAALYDKKDDFLDQLYTTIMDEKNEW